uniref:AB hydrolase-1 domain-containing protein n=1 Tax=Picea sitchensis TaxID=3332 RepID=A9P157_PICSI|nr:unknown [Picea sitchensis]
MDSESIAQGKKNMDCENLAAGGIHFVLVHGAMHGAWCWYKIVELLEKDGHKVSAIDLMSAGTNPVAADSIMSFEEYNQPLMHFLAKLPVTEKIVLVGHSMGGVSLARESEDFPHLIAVAVYVCALMFRGGESMQREKEIMEPDKHILEKIEYNFGNSIGEPPTSVLVPKKRFQKDYLYGTTSTLDATLASLLLRPLPNMAIMNMSVETTKERYGVVPRVYVKTTKDNVFCLAKQEELIASSPPEKVYSLDSDHSPFFSEPEKLHNLLLEIVDTYCN